MRRVRLLIFAVMAAAMPAVAGSGPGEIHTLPGPNNPIAFHRPPWLGIEMIPTTTGATVVPVRHVVRGSPADKAGIRSGDEIARVEATNVTTPAEVTRLVSAHAAGDHVDVSFRRNGLTQTVSVTLEPRPSHDDIMRMEYVGTFAPQLASLSAAAGTLPASVNALRGKVAVIEFWATWCGPCQLTMPVLDGLQSRYGAQGLSVIGITTEPATMAATFATQKALHYTIASDPTNATTIAYGVTSLPTLFVVDKRGVVRDVTLGYDAGAQVQLEQLVQRLIAEPISTTTTVP